MPLTPQEIQQITRTVIDRLAGRTDASAIQQEVRAALTDPPAVDTPDLTEVTPMTASSSSRARHPKAEPSDSDHNRVIVATFGRNRPGVAAALTGVLAEYNCDIADITQKILQEFFSMIMIVDITNCSVDFPALREKFAEIESRLGVTVVAQHEDVFRAMHRI